MPQLRNSSGEPLTKERKQGLIFSALTHLLLAILIIFVTFRVKIPEPVEEGLLVNFGFDETGEGLFEPAPEPVSPPPPPESAGEQGGEEALLTQDFEEAVEVEKKEPSPEEIRKQAEARAAEIRRQLEAEAERKRIEQEEAEKRKKEEEQRRIDQQNARARGAFSNAGNVGTSGQSQGVAGGQGNQGVQSGTPDAPNYGPGGGQGTEGISFDLGGRKAQSLIKPPYDLQKEGVVVVAITVDRSGRVTDATPGIKGSTTLEGDLLKLAKEAALKTRFESSNDAPIIQKGTITYVFRLK
ncbi:MAG TPA: energy transducer TonB [Bacteroidales bacterium]|nr:energy transducer TonB [Bacteroidales bacterium]MDX9926365.1 energy transducer TonB [Bacteroidales bacterium]HNV67642.1 energy transducer TonB [Bacteroidales bacterium]HNX84206.1 energy transducer TonB [Bacteroidales bacterium]HOC47139.1 energy transducer TonB [Bacteroidales bacterium]